MLLQQSSNRQSSVKVEDPADSYKQFESAVRNRKLASLSSVYSKTPSIFSSKQVTAPDDDSEDVVDKIMRLDMQRDLLGLQVAEEKSRAAANVKSYSA